VRRAKEGSTEAVLFFGPGSDAVAFLSEADRQGWHPMFLAPAPMVGGTLLTAPAHLTKTVYLASPIATPDPASPEMADFSRLVSRIGGGGDSRSFQLLAFAGAKLLEEGLRRAGRDVSRPRLIEALGGLWEFQTGVTPPLTYNENRRVGAIGAAIFKLDGETSLQAAAAPWREPK
jgi:ABC-type branched-subunit amino acid transport system substrate-binding protein